MAGWEDGTRTAAGEAGEVSSIITFLLRGMENKKITSYRDLIVWNKAMDLVLEIYTISSYFPREEMYSLTAQIKKSSISIPSNIAEGSRRSTKKDFRSFLVVAYGSGAELETQIEIAKRLDYIKVDKTKTVDMLLSEVMKMLNKLIKNLE